MLNDQTPVAGAITTELAILTLEIGRDFNTQGKLMPAMIGSVDMSSQMRKARLGKVRVSVRQTQGLYVNGYPMPERYMDSDPLDTAPAALTGTFEVQLMGWGNLVAVDFTQTDPLPMTILAAEYDVEMH